MGAAGLSLAGPDGTFGNRFDDPEGIYRVLYASSQRLGCYLEALAQFRLISRYMPNSLKSRGRTTLFHLDRFPLNGLRNESSASGSMKVAMISTAASGSECYGRHSPPIASPWA